MIVWKGVVKEKKKKKKRFSHYPFPVQIKQKKRKMTFFHFSFSSHFPLTLNLFGVRSFPLDIACGRTVPWKGTLLSKTKKHPFTPQPQMIHLQGDKRGDKPVYYVYCQTSNNAYIPYNFSFKHNINDNATQATPILSSGSLVVHNGGGLWFDGPASVRFIKFNNRQQHHVLHLKLLCLRGKKYKYKKCLDL